MSQNAGALNGIVTARHTGFGSGPIMVSLMGSPQLAAPICGLEPPPVPSAPVRDVATVSSSSGDTGMAAADTGKNIAFAR